MIRFNCPLCGKALKAAVGEAGQAVACPQCGERCVAPAADPTRPAGSPAGADLSLGQPAGLLAGMSRPTRWAVALLVVAANVSLPLALLHPLPPAVAACSFVLLCVILHGHGTGCPSCRKWWSREKVRSEFVGREVFDRGGATFARSHYRTTHACGGCGHRWCVDESEEFRAGAIADPLRRKGRTSASRKAAGRGLSG